MAWTRAAIWSLEKRIFIPSAEGKTGVLVGIKDSLTRMETEGKVAYTSRSEEYVSLYQYWPGTPGYVWVVAVAGCCGGDGCAAQKLCARWRGCGCSQRRGLCGHRRRAGREDVARAAECRRPEAGDTPDRRAGMEASVGGSGL